MILENEPDFQVLGSAADGRETVRMVRKLKPDVVLMDISMPELNGIESCYQILSENPAIKIVILSVHSSPEIITRSLDAGALGYLLKESAGVEVVEAVRCVYSGQRYLSQRISESLVNDYLRLQKEHPESSSLESLSAREREVLQLAAEGKSNKEIAKILSLSHKTVETYRSRIMTKIGVEDMAGLIKFALKHGVIQIE
jgi:DNA-binding NarL/FixJ family response regulator